MRSFIILIAAGVFCLGMGFLMMIGHRREDLERRSRRTAPSAPMMTSVPVDSTPRGFAIYDAINDDHGHTVKVQESSSVVPHLWWFISDGRELPSPPHCIDTDHLHLTLDQAKRAVSATVEWIRSYEPEWTP